MKQKKDAISRCYEEDGKGKQRSLTEADILYRIYLGQKCP